MPINKDALVNATRDPQKYGNRYINPIAQRLRLDLQNGSLPAHVQNFLYQQYLESQGILATQLTLADFLNKISNSSPATVEAELSLTLQLMFDQARAAGLNDEKATIRIANQFNYQLELYTDYEWHAIRYYQRLGQLATADRIRAKIEELRAANVHQESHIDIFANPADFPQHPGCVTAVPLGAVGLPPPAFHPIPLRLFKTNNTVQFEYPGYVAGNHASKALVEHHNSYFTASAPPQTTFSNLNPSSLLGSITSFMQHSLPGLAEIFMSFMVIFNKIGQTLENLIAKSKAKPTDDFTSNDPIRGPEDVIYRKYAPHLSAKTGGELNEQMRAATTPEARAAVLQEMGDELAKEPALSIEHDNFKFDVTLQYVSPHRVSLYKKEWLKDQNTAWQMVHDDLAGQSRFDLIQSPLDHLESKTAAELEKLLPKTEGHVGLKSVVELYAAMVSNWRRNPYEDTRYHINSVIIRRYALGLVNSIVTDPAIQTALQKIENNTKTLEALNNQFEKAKKEFQDSMAANNRGRAFIPRPLLGFVEPETPAEQVTQLKYDAYYAANNEKFRANYILTASKIALTYALNVKIESLLYPVAAHGLKDLEFDSHALRVAYHTSPRPAPPPQAAIDAWSHAAGAIFPIAASASIAMTPFVNPAPPSAGASITHSSPLVFREGGAAGGLPVPPGAGADASPAGRPSVGVSPLGSVPQL